MEYVIEFYSGKNHRFNKVVGSIEEVQSLQSKYSKKFSFKVWAV